MYYISMVAAPQPLPWLPVHSVHVGYVWGSSLVHFHGYRSTASMSSFVYFQGYRYTASTRGLSGSCFLSISMDPWSSYSVHVVPVRASSLVYFQGYRYTASPWCLSGKRLLFISMGNGLQRPRGACQGVVSCLFPWIPVYSVHVGSVRVPSLVYFHGYRSTASTWGLSWCRLLSISMVTGLQRPRGVCQGAVTGLFLWLPVHSVYLGSVWVSSHV